MFFKKLFKKGKKKTDKPISRSQSPKDSKSKGKPKPKSKNTKSIVEMIDNKFLGLISSRAHQAYIVEGPFVVKEKISQGRKWVVNMILPNGYIYSGEIDSSKKIQGKGVLVKKDGSIFEGNFEDGRLRGEGRLIDSEGVVYLGVFIGKYLDTRGKITSNSGKQVYVGEVNRNLPHGKGEESWDNGSRFVGSFNKGRREGYGEFYWNDKSAFKGEFVNHNIEGFGIYSWPDGRLYEGQWLKNKMSGVGIYTWSDEKVYKGQFEDGNRKGFGILDNPDGSWYVGFWINSKKEGCGMEYYEGILINGVWKNGELHETIKQKKTKSKKALQAKRAIIDELAPKTKEMAKMNLLDNIAEILNESRIEHMSKPAVEHINESSSADEEYTIVDQDLDFEEELAPKKQSGKMILSEPVEKLQNYEIEISDEEPVRKKKSKKKKIDESIQELSRYESEVSYSKKKKPDESMQELSRYESEVSYSKKKKPDESIQELSRYESEVSYSKKKKPDESIQELSQYESEVSYSKKKRSKKKRRKQNSSYYEAEESSVNLSEQVFIPTDKEESYVESVRNESLVSEKRKKKEFKQEIEYDREISYAESFKSRQKEESMQGDSMELSRFKDELKSDAGSFLDQSSMTAKRLARMTVDDASRSFVDQDFKKRTKNTYLTHKVESQSSVSIKPSNTATNLTQTPVNLSIPKSRLDISQSSQKLSVNDPYADEPSQSSYNISAVPIPTQLTIQDKSSSINKTQETKPISKSPHIKSSDRSFSNTQPQCSDMRSVPSQLPYQQLHRDNSRFSSSPSSSSSSSSSEKDFRPQTQHSKPIPVDVVTSQKTQEPARLTFNPPVQISRVSETQSKASARDSEASFMAYDTEEDRNYRIFKADMRKLLNTSLSSISSLHDDNLRVQEIDSSFDLQFRNFLSDAEDVQFLNDIKQYEASLTSKQSTTKGELKTPGSIDKPGSSIKQASLNRIIEEVKSINNEPQKSSSEQDSSIQDPGSANFKKFPGHEGTVKPPELDKQLFVSLNNFAYPSLKRKNNPAYLNRDINSEPSSDSSTLLEKQSQYPSVDNSAFISVPEQRRISHLLNLTTSYSELENQHLIQPIRDEVGPFIYSEPSSFSPLYFVDWLEVSRKIIYKGEVNSSGYLEGRGVMFSSEFLYEGYWLDGRMEGLGRMIYSNGDIYEGYWNANLKSGFGVMWKITGDGYVGDWFKGVYHGRGMEVTGATVYEGDFNKGTKKGKGKIIYRNGDVYEGDLLNGGPHGYGMMIWSDGKGYVGMWNGGEMSKKGIHVTKDVCKLNMDVFNAPTPKSKLSEVTKQTRR